MHPLEQKTRRLLFSVPSAAVLRIPLYQRTLSYGKRQIYLPFTIAASGGCERARKEISRFAARARRGVNVQNEIHFDVYDIYRTSGIERRIIMKTTGELLNRFVKILFAVRAADK